MAEFEVDFPDDLLEGLLKTADEETIKAMINEAAPILEESMRKSMEAVIGHDGDSELINSVHTSATVRAKTGAYIANVGPKGYSNHYFNRNGKKKRKYKVSNALKAIWLNYGRAGQPARPFMAKAVNNAQEAVLHKMQETYERILNK